jgi:Domain of unknown function (DUF4037)
MTTFIKGRELSRIFYDEAVRPLLDQYFPHLAYTAGCFGYGSDVLGFDTEMSRDHDWGPTVHLILRERDLNKADDIREVMATRLPLEIRGYSTHFGQHTSDGTQVMNASTDGRINHRVHVLTLRQYMAQHLHWNIDHDLDAADWLSFPAQVLRCIQDGWIHHDSAREWTAIRAKLAWYPHDVWLYLLAASWKRISQEDHLMGRAGYVGDELGSHLIASRLVRDLMFLCFLQEKQYAPYPKWFGTAFQQLNCAADLTPILRRVQLGASWQMREAALCEAGEFVAHKHNALNITTPIPTTAAQFHDRPFRVLHSMGADTALLSAITDPQVRRLTALPALIGSIDQFSDSTDLRSYLAWRAKIRALYLD